MSLRGDDTDRLISEDSRDVGKERLSRYYDKSMREITNH